MATQRKSISIPPHEVEILKQLYLEYRFPSDQYQRRPRELQRFTDSWNGLTNRSDNSGDILHFIITRRKRNNWVTFGGNYNKLSTMPNDFLSQREWCILRDIYEEMLIPLQQGSDNLAYDDLLASKLSREFHDRAGRTVFGRLLFAAIMKKRKRGDWVKIYPTADDTPQDERVRRGRGFGDIDQLTA